MARVHLHHMWILAALLSAMLLYSSLSPPYHFKPSHIPFSSMGVEKAGGSDSDSDGLKDLEEDANMNGLLDHFEISPTSPFNYDTDSDGIPDGEEYNYWVHRSETEPPGTLAEISAALGEIETMELLGPLGDIDFDGLPNVIDYDSDSDGLGDGEELKLALDPASPDSDGDTVPDAYERYPGVEDSDGDGIDDVWEEYWGTSREDRDGDGVWDYVNPAYDYDSDGNPDTGKLNKGSTFRVVLEVQVPADFNKSNRITLTATADKDANVTDSAYDDVMIPEFSDVVIPVAGMLIMFTAFGRNRKKRKRDEEETDDDKEEADEA